MRSLTLPIVRNLGLSMLLLSTLSGSRVLAADARVRPSVASEFKQVGDLDLRSPSGEQVSPIPYVTRKPIVVMFWAAWCPICRAEAPRINQLNANPKVKVIAVNEGDTPQQIEAFIADYKVGYQVVVDPVADLAKAFKVPGMPYGVIIDRSGLVVYRGYKLPENIDDYLR